MKLQIKKLTCCECGRECANMTELGNHIRDDHGMNTHVYYDKHIAKENEGKCLNCGGHVDFNSLLQGYNKFCSIKCGKEYADKHPTYAQIECPACGAIVSADNNNRCAILFNKHLKDVHEWTPKEYYDKFLKKEGEGFCKECGKATEFMKISVGYHVFCSNACCMKYNHKQRKAAYEEQVAVKTAAEEKAEQEAKIQEEWQEEMKRRLAEFEGDRSSMTYTDGGFERTFMPEISFYGF